jgi:cobalt ECF transporter T component CbiQ
MQKLLATVEDSLFAEDVAASPGFLQSLDARVKLAGISALLISAIAVRQVLILVVLFAAATILGILSHVRLARIAKHVWLSVLAFTGTIAVPALLVVKGTPLVHVPLLGWPISKQAVISVALLILRAETCATLAFLLVLCTPWNRLLRALRWFRVPASVTFIIEMTYRYLFLLIQSAQDMIESRRARLVGVIHPAEQRRMAAAMGAVLLDKSLHLSSEVVAAMEARGYRGDVRLLNDRALKANDWFRVLAFVAIAAAAVWVGR